HCLRSSLISSCGRPAPPIVSSQPTGWNATPLGSLCSSVYFSSLWRKHFRSSSSPLGEPMKTRYCVSSFGTVDYSLRIDLSLAEGLVGYSGPLNATRNSLAKIQEFYAVKLCQCNHARSACRNQGQISPLHATRPFDRVGRAEILARRLLFRGHPPQFIPSAAR